jgi:hypothetical protein
MDKSVSLQLQGFCYLPAISYFFFPVNPEILREIAVSFCGRIGGPRTPFCLADMDSNLPLHFGILHQ